VQCVYYINSAVHGCSISLLVGVLRLIPEFSFRTEHCGDIFCHGNRIIGESLPLTNNTYSRLGTPTSLSQSNLALTFCTFDKGPRFTAVARSSHRCLGAQSYVAALSKYFSSQSRRLPDRLLWCRRRWTENWTRSSPAYCVCSIRLRSN